MTITAMLQLTNGDNSIAQIAEENTLLCKKLSVQSVNLGMKVI